MHDTLANRGKVNYDAYSAEQQYEMQRLAMQFMGGEIEELDDIGSMR